jgi:hypothetical protein
VGAIAVAAPALAKTYQVSGELVPQNASGSQLRINGGLLGTWKTTSNKTLGTKPLIHARGTERFVGCLDVAQDGSCAGDPTGSLRLSYEYWAKPGAKKNSIAWGTCVHPIKGGTGDFKGATGIVSMVDTPLEDGSVRTDYIGNITIAGAAANAAAAPRCGARN